MNDYSRRQQWEDENRNDNMANFIYQEIDSLSEGLQNELAEDTFQVVTEYNDGSLKSSWKEEIDRVIWAGFDEYLWDCYDEAIWDEEMKRDYIDNIM